MNAYLAYIQVLQTLINLQVLPTLLHKLSEDTTLIPEIE